VLGSDGAKLSKRHGAVSVMQYGEDGFLPEALVNFLARLGWSHGDDEIFTRQQLIEWFDVRHIHPAPARFDADKLRWVNHEHIKRLGDAELGDRLRPFLEGAGLNVAGGPPLASVATLLRDRAATLTEMADAAHYFYATPHPSAEQLAAQISDANRPALSQLYAEFATLDWRPEAIAPALRAAASAHGLKAPQVMMPLRILVAASPSTPAIDAVLALLGREKVRERMARGLGL